MGKVLPYKRKDKGPVKPKDSETKLLENPNTAYERITYVKSNAYLMDTTNSYNQKAIEINRDLPSKLPKSKKRIEHAEGYIKDLIGEILNSDLEGADDDALRGFYAGIFIAAVNEAAGTKAEKITDAQQILKRKDFNYKKFLDNLPEITAHQHVNLKRSMIYQQTYDAMEEGKGFKKDEVQDKLFDMFIKEGGKKILEGKVDEEDIKSSDIEKLIDFKTKYQEGIAMAIGKEADFKKGKKDEELKEAA